MVSVESPEAVIHRFAELLDAAGVPYMLTGSFASGFHGAPRATQDIDIVIAPTLGSLNQFLRLLPEDKYYVSREAALDAYGRGSLFNVVDFASGWKIDLICRKGRAFSVVEFERRSPRELAGLNIFVASPEDVVLGASAYMGDTLDRRSDSEKLSPRSHQERPETAVRQPRAFGCVA